MCVYERDGVCMDGEGEGVYMEWVKRVVTGRGYVYTEWVECACTGRGCVLTEGVKCAWGEGR